MERVDVTLSELTRRSRTVRVSHSAAGLTRGLELGESLLVHDEETGFFSAVVAEVEFELEDTIYLLAIGVRVPEELAEEKLAGRAPAHDDDSLSLHDVIELLGQVRAGTKVPSPRRESANSQTELGARTKR